MASALESAVGALRCRYASQPAPDAAGVLARLTGALGHHDTRFLDDYLRVLVSHNDAEVKTITDELMRNVEGALEAREGDCARVEVADPVVLASWLAASTTWRAPRVPAAPRALQSILQEFAPVQVAEVAQALHGALEPREIIVVSDALREFAARGASAGAARAWAIAGESERLRELVGLLVRVALGKLLGSEIAWCSAPPLLTVEEVFSALVPRWETLSTEDQLTGASVAARVTANAAVSQDGKREKDAGVAAERLLAVLAHPPPVALRHHPDYLKSIIALSKLQRLFKSEFTPD